MTQKANMDIREAMKAAKVTWPMIANKMYANKATIGRWLNNENMSDDLRREFFEKIEECRKELKK